LLIELHAIKLTNRGLGPDVGRNVTVVCCTKLVAAEHISLLQTTMQRHS